MGYIVYFKTSPSKTNPAENGIANPQQMTTPGQQEMETEGISVPNENDYVTIGPSVEAVVVKHYDPKVPREAPADRIWCKYCREYKTIVSNHFLYFHPGKTPPPPPSVPGADSNPIIKSKEVSKKRKAESTPSTSSSSTPRIIRIRKPAYKRIAWDSVEILSAHQHKKLEVDMAVAAALPPNMGAFFTPAKITRNYNALYSSLAKALLGEETLQGQIRALVLDEMVRCTSDLRPFMRYHGMNFDLLLKHVKAANDGLNPVVIFIASEIIQRPIYVYEDFSPTTVRRHMVFNSNPAMESKYPLLLMFKDEHIVPLIPACAEAPFPPITSRAFPAAKYKYLVAPPLTPPPPNVKLSDLMPEIQMLEGEEELELIELLDDDVVEMVPQPPKKRKLENDGFVVKNCKEVVAPKCSLKAKDERSNGIDLNLKIMKYENPVPVQCGICQLKLTTPEFMEHHNNFHSGRVISLVMDQPIRGSSENLNPPIRPHSGNGNPPTIKPHLGNLDLPIGQRSRNLDLPIGQRPGNLNLPFRPHPGNLDLPIGQRLGNLDLLIGQRPGNLDLPIGQRPGNLDLPFRPYPGNLDLPIGQRPGNLDLPIGQRPGNLDLPIGQRPGNLNLPIGQSPGNLNLPIGQGPGNLNLPIGQRRGNLNLPISRSLDDTDTLPRPPTKRYPTSSGSQGLVNQTLLAQSNEPSSGASRRCYAPCRKAKPSSTATSQSNQNEEKEIQHLRIEIDEEILAARIRELFESESTDSCESEAADDGGSFESSCSSEDDNKVGKGNVVFSAEKEFLDKYS